MACLSVCMSPCACVCVGVPVLKAKHCGWCTCGSLVGVGVEVWLEYIDVTCLSVCACVCTYVCSWCRHGSMAGGVVLL